MEEKIIDLLKAEESRNDFKVIFGGAPVTPKWVEECGADGYAENAVSAVSLAKKLLNKS